MRVLSISVHGLEMPVGECPCIARGACPFLCPWSAWCFVYRTSAHVQIRTTVLYVGTKKGRTPTNHVRTMRVLSISVHGLEMPVGECPCIASGACPFLCPWSAWCFVYRTSAHVQQIRTTVLYVGTKKGRTPTNHVRTKFHLIERINGFP